MNIKNYIAIMQNNDKRAQLFGNASFNTQMATALYLALADFGSASKGSIDPELIFTANKIPDPDFNYLPDSKELKGNAEIILDQIKEGNARAVKFSIAVLEWLFDPSSESAVKELCDKYRIAIDSSALDQAISGDTKKSDQIMNVIKGISNIIRGLVKPDGGITDLAASEYFNEADGILKTFTYAYDGNGHTGKIGVSDDKIVLSIDDTSHDININVNSNEMVQKVANALFVRQAMPEVKGAVSNALELCHYMNAGMKHTDDTIISESAPMNSVPPDLKEDVVTLVRKIMSGEGWTVMNQQGEGGEVTIPGEENDIITITVPDKQESKPVIKCSVKGHGYTWKNANGVQLKQATPDQWAMFAIVSYAKTRTLVGETRSDELPTGITNSPDTGMFDPQMWLIAGKDEYKQINMKSDAIQAILSKQDTPADKRLAKEWYRRIRSGFATINFGNAFLNSFRKMPIKILKSIFNKDERIRVSRCPLYTTGETDGNKMKVENYTGGKTSVGTAYLNTYYKCIKAKNGNGWVFNPLSNNGTAAEQVYTSLKNTGNTTLIISRMGNDRLTVQLIPDSDASVLFTDQYGEL